MRHGGFYTKDDLREIVRYAAERGITVVPEIDLPGHMQAAIAAYPELGTIRREALQCAEIWGISEEVLGASDEALEFVGAVLSEVAELFPGPYVHIGGDECPTTLWEQSAAAHAADGPARVHPAASAAGLVHRRTPPRCSRRTASGSWGGTRSSRRSDREDAVVMAWRSADEGVHGVSVQGTTS